MAKDLDWAVSSIDPEKIIEVILKKVALRREFFQELSSTNLVNKKDREKEEEQEGPVKVGAENLEKLELERVEKAGNRQASKVNWEQFMQDVFKKYPALGANLEQGNILSGPEVSDDTLSINIGFDSSAEVFLDYLRDAQVFKRLKEIVQEYFGVKRSRIELSYVSPERRQQTKFQSRREIAEEKSIIEQEKAKEKLLNNEYVKEAQALFRSEVDRVVLNGH